MPLLPKMKRRKKWIRLSASEKRERNREKEVWMGEGNDVEYGNMKGKKRAP